MNVRYPAKADIQYMLRLKILNKHVPIGDCMLKETDLSVWVIEMKALSIQEVGST